MAKVKNKKKAPKRASRKNKNCKQKSLAGKNDEAVKDSTVMRRPSNLKLLTSEEKVNYLIENGLRLGKKLCQKTSSISKPKNNKPRDRLITRSGRIVKNGNNDFKLIDNILRSELLIDDKTKTHKQTKNITHKQTKNITNKQKKNITNSIIRSKNNNSTKITNKNKKPVKTNNTKAIKKKKKEVIVEKIKKKRTPKPKVKLVDGLLIQIPLVQCDYCNKSFSNKFSLRRHIYGHLYRKPFACLYCQKRYQYIANKNIHEKKEHADVRMEPGIYVCDVCSKPFLLKENLTLHLNSHKKNEHLYKCMYCNKQYAHHLLLNHHERQHLVSGKYQCSLCTLSYSFRNELVSHVKSHLRIKDYICQYCGKDFLRLNSMRRHVQICHAGHRVNCPICNKSLKGHLAEHMRTHDNKRPHECPDCGQGFTQSTQLKVHRRSHTGDKPYTCRICDKSFSHSNAMMLHIRRHTGEKPFLCACCPIAFSQLPHMKAHMRNIHGKDDPYKCKKCNQFFKLKTELECHVCKKGDKGRDKKNDQGENDSAMDLTRMRFLLALLFTMIASKDKLKCLGFNKRLIDELLHDSLEAMDKTPCKDKKLSPLKRLKINVQMLLNNTVPKHQMQKFRNEGRTTEEILELLTDEKKKNA